MLYTLGFESPRSVSGEYFVAPNAAVIGRVHLGRDASVWFGAVLRGDTNDIEIGDGTNIQDNSVVHVDDDAPARLGENVTVGHAAVVHGCTIGRGSLIGIGATILSHAEIGEYCIVGAGALITERKTFADRSLIVGVPARRIRDVTEEEVAMLEETATHYVDLSRRYKAGLKAREK